MLFSIATVMTTYRVMPQRFWCRCRAGFLTGDEFNGSVSGSDTFVFTSKDGSTQNLPGGEVSLAILSRTTPLMRISLSLRAWKGSLHGVSSSL